MFKIKAGDKVSWLEQTSKVRQRRKDEPLNEEWITEIGNPITVHGKVADLSRISLPVRAKNGNTLMFYRDLKPVQKDKVSYAFKLPDIIRIVKGTEGLTDEEETIKGRTVRRVAKLGYLGNILIPVITKDGAKKSVEYNKLKFYGGK